MGDPVFFAMACAVTAGAAAAVYLVPKYNDDVNPWFWVVLALVVFSFWMAWWRVR